MTETGVNAFSNQLDVEQILLEAQHRWLRPAEICEILQNHHKFLIAPEPPNMPPSGTLFLFDRNVLRWFRKDGHKWRKKKDGKTVKETHEKLKAGSVNMLHCYYAHGEENKNFQRRSYWMLDEKVQHIVLVHYLEVKGNQANFSVVKGAEETIPYSQEIVSNSVMESSVTSVSSIFHPNNYQTPSQTTDSTSLNSVHAAESVCNHQASFRLRSLLESQQLAIDKTDAGCSDFYDPMPFQAKLDDIVELQGKVVKIWDAMDNIAKHCIKHCALYPKGEWIDKRSLISDWIKDLLVYSHDEGNFVLRNLTNAFLVEDGLTDAFLMEDYVGNRVQLNGEIYDVLVNLLVPKMCPLFLKQGEFGKTKSMKEEEWNAKEIYLMDNEIYELPESPNCPSLIALYLQRNYDLTVIPPLFFDHMPVLHVLDLSHTSIKSLPESLPKLVALRKLVLRGCELFMELSPQVGELENLEELDLEETQILYLPVEIGKLVKLKRLRASFYADMNCRQKRLQSSTLIHTGVISNLSQLNELSIDVNPDDERWNATVEAIIEEVCSSKLLNTLSLYLPKVELLKKLGSTSLMYHPLSRFSFVVGRPKRRIISRVPDEVEARFEEWDKCLKFVDGWDIPDEITMVLEKATAFYLERNATAVTLSEFLIENMRELKLCILSECNEMQTIIGGGEFHEARSDKEEEEEDESYFDFEYDSDSSEEVVLESLLYLGIYYMNNLRSIWNGPIHKGSLSNLKFLVIHTCPKLSTIFSVDLLANLMELEELIIEDCPQVTSLVSHASPNPVSVDYLPSLRKISLLFLPELVNISGGLDIAPKLERIGFYYCPKLENLSKTELSSKNLKVIKGERKWWDEALRWNESDWGSRPDHLNDIFHEIDEEKDVRTQLTEQE